MNLSFETDGLNFNSKGKPDEIATPQNICNDMSNLFDFTDCNRKIWMDIFCKTGNTLEALKENGVSKNNIAAVCNNKQSQMLECRKLYGKILPEIEVEITVKSLEAYKITRRGQVYWVSNWQDIVKNNYQNAYNIIKFVILKEMEKTMKLEWNSDKEFQINNIIMNPPYNPSDLYIDFVTLAHKIASDSVVAITPAKWQAKGGEKNEQFRKDVVPYMSDIMYYVNSGDVFDIREVTGISYYLIDKNIHKEKNIKTVDKTINHEKLNDDWHIEYNIITLHSRKLNNIITKITDKKLKYTGGDGNKKVIVSLNLANGGGKTSFSSFSSEGLMNVVNPLIKINNIQELAKYGTNYKVIYNFNTDYECESFISYVNTRFVRFCIYMGICGQSITNEETWRFVPDPANFDHIFTDQELYEKYNLTQEEISIIESVIKERK